VFINYIVTVKSDAKKWFMVNLQQKWKRLIKHFFDLALFHFVHFKLFLGRKHGMTGRDKRMWESHMCLCLRTFCWFPFIALISFEKKILILQLSGNWLTKQISAEKRHKTHKIADSIADPKYWMCLVEMFIAHSDKSIESISNYQ